MQEAVFEAVRNSLSCNKKVLLRVEGAHSEAHCISKPLFQKQSTAGKPQKKECLRGDEASMRNARNNYQFQQQVPRGVWSHMHVCRCAYHRLTAVMTVSESRMMISGTLTLCMHTRSGFSLNMRWQMMR